jgi:hypothetical protein
MSGHGIRLLHRAGWSVGDVHVLTAEGPTWLVSDSNGKNAVSARGATFSGKPSLFKK